MGIRLTDLDEGLHACGKEINWNESRYVDFWDPVSGVGGWFRIGARPNANYAEVSSCVFLPDGRVAFAFQRAHIDDNPLAVGGQTWDVADPWHFTRFAFSGELSILADPWALTNPKAALSAAPRVLADIQLELCTEGLGATMGQDQDQHHLIFLPGQADFHYQHIAHVTGRMIIGNETFDVDGRGAKDHSWGPRNWHAKIYLRWLIGSIDDDNGFMITRAVGPTKTTRSGFMWIDRAFHVVDEVKIVNTYEGAPHYELRSVALTMRAGDTTWSAVGTPQNYLPLRHRQPGVDGEEATLRIVKQPATWSLGDGRTATGHLEYHDLMQHGIPVGLHD
jgi:hypothetical protein